MYKNSNANVLAFTKYSYEGPSSRYRFYNYQECFEKKRLKLTIKPLFSRSYFTANTKYRKHMIVLFAYFVRLIHVFHILILDKKYDLILIEYELFPYFPALFEFFLKKRGIRYIVDYDDAIFHKYDISQDDRKKVAKDFFRKLKTLADWQYNINKLKGIFSKIGLFIRFPRFYSYSIYNKYLKK